MLHAREACRRQTGGEGLWNLSVEVSPEPALQAALHVNKKIAQRTGV